MDIHQFWLFALASLLLNLTPGNDMLYVISRSTGQGTRAGIISALGIAGGCLVHLSAAVVGLSAIIAGSAVAFTVIKYAGALYLVYLGVGSLLEKRTLLQVPAARDMVPYAKIFYQGVLTNVLNPKVALFFLAYLPQFLDAGDAHPQGRILLLGIWFNFSGTLVNMVVAVLFGKLGSWMTRSSAWGGLQKKITGLMLIGLGVRIGLTTKN